tara:strand:- start:4215 stop:4769 length:555 start_codon:yes stop_codon:yes gene_type:complete
MKHKSKFQILLVTTVSVVAIYCWDLYRVVEDINYNREQIGVQNYKLSQADFIREKIENFQHLFLKKKKEMISHGITGSQLAEEVKLLKSQANLSGVQIDNIEIHSLNTFPFYFGSSKTERIPLERHIISVEAKGRFLKIGALIENIHNKSDHLEIGECLFSLDEEDPKGVIASLKYYTYTESRP